MNPHPDKIHILPVFIALSVLAHVLVFYPLGSLGSYNFAAPVNRLHVIPVDLVRPSAENEPAADSSGQDRIGAGNNAEETKAERDSGPAEEADDTPHAGLLESNSGPEPSKDAAVIAEGNVVAPTREDESSSGPAPVAPREGLYAIRPPLRTAGEFLATKRETLSYQIKLLGVPAGSAELEAKSEQGEVRITLRVKSNPVISTIYPVDDFIETRHIGGNFLLTRIRQQEGTFRRDIGFTIFLRDKYVFWIDRLNNRVARDQIPNGEVLDLISGFYFLRNQPLQVGTTVPLHIYDSDIYAQVPVEVLRRERVNLPGFRKAETLVVRPLLKTGGIFKRTGDVLIWLTADDYKVPVKVETQIPLGKVTAELVSAETER